MCTSQQLVGNNAPRVDVRAVVNSRANGLLGRHVARETLGAHPFGQLGCNRFHHDRATQECFVRDEDARHAAPAEFALDGVAVAEGGLQLRA